MSKRFRAGSSSSGAIALLAFASACSNPDAIEHPRTSSPRTTAAMSASVCPPVGADTGCGTIITVTDSGVTIVSTGQGPYDNIEDTMLGVINQSSRPVGALGLKSASTIFGFDGDGIDIYGVPGNPLDNTGYGGPNAYFTDVSSDLTAGTVRFITPIPAGGTAYFSLEEAISNAYSCQEVVNNAVQPQASGANIDAAFKPNLNLTLQEAARFCGFTDFDWVQQITRQDDPSDFYARNLGGAFRASVSGPVRLTSATTPFSDPPQGGGYTYSAQPDFSYPFYYNVATELPGQKSGGNTLNFHDAPADPCLPGGLKAGTAPCDNTSEPPGSFGGYTTHLAGVNSDGTAKDLGIGFTWRSTYNGTTGGTQIKKTFQLADGNGTGGVTITSVQTVTSYQYNGVTVTTVNGAPVGGAVPPSISSLIASPSVLWPPNHKLVPVALAVAASDGSGVDPICSIGGVSSNEAPLTAGVSDWTVTGPLTLRLRAERAGTGTGRIYTITVTCTNAAALSASKDVTVSVPHDQAP
jgi:hypothetical protein